MAILEADAPGDEMARSGRADEVATVIHGAAEGRVSKASNGGGGHELMVCTELHDPVAAVGPECFGGENATFEGDSLLGVGTAEDCKEQEDGKKECFHFSLELTLMFTFLLPKRSGSEPGTRFRSK